MNNAVLEKYLPQNKRVRMLILMAVDVCAICFASFLGLFIRFDMNIARIPKEYAQASEHYLPLYVIVTIVIFLLFKMYATMWSVAGIREVLYIVVSCALSSVIQITGMMFLEHKVPRSYYLISFAALVGMEIIIRLSYRILEVFTNNRFVKKNKKHVMIVGAGDSGAVILKEMTTSRFTEGIAVCFVDDDPNKVGKIFNGVPVAGKREDIPQLVEKYAVDIIYVAIPTASAENRKEIIEICKQTDCEVKTLPGIYQLMNGEVSVSKLRHVEIEDLLGRDPIRVNLDEIMGYVSGKIVMVTGGGGSIGSELCRQIAAHNPKQLIIFDIYENNAYDIQLELKKKYPELNLEVRIGSVRDSRLMFKIFETYHPEIVYHAAAHKHVPLMEDSPCEAIKNNAIGTYKTAYAALVYGCKRFVLISTDKAVNPTNCMGASKRLCEMVIQAFDHKVKEGKADELPQLFTHSMSDMTTRPEVIEALKHAKTEFVAVRFGNVLGSNGSVIPLFKRQIEAGGPVTVTHPDIIRYFMTIPEAVSLVLQAGAYAHGGEIFVLDMGNPVKIDTLARNLIRLSGHQPDVDIKIEYTGLRPGEKLYEEKLMAEEGLKKTQNKLIHIGCPIPFDIEEFLGQLEGLMDAAYKNKENIRDILKQVVSTYHPTK